MSAKEAARAELARWLAGGKGFTLADALRWEDHGLGVIRHRNGVPVFIPTETPQ